MVLRNLLAAACKHNFLQAALQPINKLVFPKAGP
jgi:hypothetical protein